MLALALAGCGSISEDSVIARGVPRASSPSPSVQQGELAVQNARSAEHVKLIGSYGGIYSNARIEGMVASLVGRLVEASDAPDRSVRVTILNSPAVNAFALPSGDLYVTRGLIALASDQSELAAVIAHELAHVTRNHAALRQRQARAAALARRVSEVVVDPTIKAETREQAELSPAAFSRQQELEADEVSVRTLARAGFDPFASARFLESMADYAALPSPNAASEGQPGFLSSHPTTPARIDRARRVARGYAAPGLGRTARNAYLKSLDGMLYGDDPREGYVRGREFAHVEFGVAFTVPEGYVLKNTSAAVLATDGEQTAVRFDAVEIPPDQSLADYLRSGWIKGLVEDSIRSRTGGGLETAVASALVEGWSFRIGVVRGPQRVYRFIFASSDPTGGYESAFRRTVDSFRLLSPSQRAAMRPLRLRVLPVGRDDTVETFTRRMRGVDPAIERRLFETLNGLEPGEMLRAGDLAKIVTE